MNVLHITTSSKGGAGIAALRLHKALQEKGIASAYLSINLSIDYDDKVLEDTFFHYQKPTFFKKLKTKIATFFTFSERLKTEKEFRTLEPQMQFEIATLPFSNYKIQEHPLFKQADIINLHWIDGLIDYQSFFPFCTKPIVWTLHDMNPFLGIFHYHNDEVVNATVSASLDSKVRLLKKNAVQKIAKGAFVTPSKWLFSEAAKMEIFTNFQRYHIPNAIDLETFRVQDKGILRKTYGIDANEFVVLFVSDSLENPRKGFDLLLEALQFLQHKNITILTIGKGKSPSIEGLKIISLGAITSAATMAECYALADVFVLPSREDNLPNVMLESFASGTPMIGFAVGGIAEHTIDGFTGILVQELSGSALANAIVTLQATKNNYSSALIRDYAEAHFSFSKQADSYNEVYTALLYKE